jgi:predicted molibdopterin-dependent oxidoreductase YjgC
LSGLFFGCDFLNNGRIGRRLASARDEAVLAAAAVPAGLTARLAVATKGDGLVNQHFGHATELQIYDVTREGARLAGIRKVENYCRAGDGDEGSLEAILRAVSDCAAVLVAKVGRCPKERLAGKVESGMEVQTDSERVRLSRKMVLEFLGSSVDLSTAPAAAGYIDRYGADTARYGPAAAPANAGERDAHDAGHHHAPSGTESQTVAQPVKVDNDLYVRDYSKCILCYKCVEACGEDAQNTFAIAVAGRGFDARISTEAAVPLPDSACVYCGNCIGVCPTGALMFKSEHDMRAAGTWDESAQTVTETICPYCGVGCALELHVQDNTIVTVTSPLDSSVTDGHLCVKGRFGFQFVQSRGPRQSP